MAEQSYSQLRSYPALASINLANGTASRTAPIFSSFKAMAIMCVVTTAVSDDGVITVNRETKYGVTTDDIEIGTFTVPVLASGVGTVYVANLDQIADTDLVPGEGISFTPSSDGVGVVWCGVIGFEYQEGPAAYGNTAATLFANTTKLRSGQGSIRQLVFTQT